MSAVLRQVRIRPLAQVRFTAGVMGRTTLYAPDWCGDGWRRTLSAHGWDRDSELPPVSDKT